MKNSKKIKKLAFCFFILCSCTLFSCGETVIEQPKDFEINYSCIVDQSCYEINENFTFDLELDNTYTVNWKITNNDDDVVMSGTSSLISGDFDEYGEYHLNVQILHNGITKSKDFTLFCRDITAPRITKSPQNASHEAGQEYNFINDISSIEAFDNSSTVFPKITSIYKDGVLQKSDNYITSYRFTKTGLYTIEFRVYDSNENFSIGHYLINVVDTTSPIFHGESSYTIYLDEEFNALLPEIEIEEYSEYTLDITAKFDKTDVEVMNGKLVAPKIGDYVVTYIADDHINPISTFTINVSVVNLPPEVSLENNLGYVYAGELIELPTPIIKRISNAITKYYIVESDSSTIEVNKKSTDFTKPGTYKIRVVISGTYYYGGELHPEDGFEEVNYFHEFDLDVLVPGNIDFEDHNNGNLEFDIGVEAPGVVKVAPGEGYNGTNALLFEYMQIGFNRKLILKKPIKVPNNYDSVRVWVKCGGKKAEGSMYLLLKDSTGVSAQLDFDIDALHGQFYTLPLNGKKLVDISEIYIANTRGQNGETWVNPETGIVESIGENRDFYIDCIEMIEAPVLNVDKSDIKRVYVQGNGFDIPVPTVSKWSDDYNVDLYVTHNGVKKKYSTYHIDSLDVGTYLFEYSCNLLGAHLYDSFEINVFENKPQLLMFNDYGVLREGQSVVLPIPYIINMPNITQEDIKTYYSFEQGEFIEGKSIQLLQQGTYTCKVTCEFNSQIYESSVDFEVIGINSKFTFKEVNNGIDGEFTETIGEAGVSAYFQDNNLKLTGWWTGVKFKEPLEIKYLYQIQFKIKSSSYIDKSAIRIIDQNNQMFSTEDLGIFYNIDTEETTILVDLPNSIKQVKGFEVLTRSNGAVQVSISSIEVFGKEPVIPEGKTSVFGDKLVGISTSEGTCYNDTDLGYLSVTSAWWVHCNIENNQVMIPSNATKMIIDIKSNAKLVDSNFKIYTEKGPVYETETNNIEIDEEFSEITVPFNNLDNVDSYLTEIDFMPQDNGSGVWRILTIKSIRFE